MVLQDVLLKLLLYNYLHNLADNVQKRDGAVHTWIELVDRDNRMLSSISLEIHLVKNIAQTSH